ncbi:MAG: histidine kinase [Actinomycetia bacterium]|nr:histidine kinase [Actinomycetes bacterium]
MRARLVLLSLAVSTMVALAFLVPLAVLVRDVARDRALTAGERDAAAVAPVLALSSRPQVVEPALERTEAGADHRLTVHLPDGGVIGAPHRVGPDVETAMRTGRSFSRKVPGGVRLYQPVVLPGGATAVVTVLVPSGELTHGVTRSWAALIVVALALVLASVAIADRLGAAVVGPTRELVAAAGALGEGDLDRTVEASGPPELVDLAAAFNRLGGRVRHLLAQEREVVADLSHRLRTPLTALRLDADALGPGEEADRVRADADRLEDAVTTLIAEARHPGRGRAADAAAVVAERAAFWSPLAEEQGRAWDVHIEASGEVAASAADLEAAVDALLGNVFAHTEEGTPVAVSVGRDGGWVVVTVDDGGPGLPADAVDRGTSGSGSSGLGLDIARRTAETGGGTLVLDRSPAGGTRVALRLAPC